MQNEDEIYRGGEDYVLHPAIRAIGWFKDWAIWSVFAAVIWQWIDGSLRSVSVGSVLARAAIVCSLLAAGAVPLELLQQWLRFREQARSRYRYDPTLRRFGIAVVSAIALVLFAAYVLVAWWVLGWVWPPMWTLASMFGNAGVELPQLVVPLWGAILIVGAAGYVAFHMVRPIPAKHFRVWRILGRRRALKGYGLMAILRLRQPRRDFFFQGPLVRNVPVLATAAVVHTFVEPPLVAFALPCFLITVSLAATLDHLVPPAWLFLGRSHPDSYVTFDILREQWRVFGVTFLNRDSANWFNYYFAEAERIGRRRPFARLFMTNPRAPRVWSLRSRGDMWEGSVAMLMELTSVIVVDARVKSYWIFDELLWLAEFGWIEKAWLLGNPDGRAPALEGALTWADDEKVVLPPKSAERLAERVITGKQLSATRWTEEGVDNTFLRL